MIMIMSMDLVPWLFLFPASLWMLLSRSVRGPLLLFTVGYLCAFAVGQLTWLSLPSLVLLFASAGAVQAQRPQPVRMLGYALFIAVALSLRAHLVPGFHNPLVLDTQFSEGATRFRMYFNLDKLLIVLWVAYAWRQVKWEASPQRAVAVGVVVSAATLVLCIGMAWGSGLVVWDPKWPSTAWVWALNNLLLVCVAEEVLFRGFIQSGLSQQWRKWRHGPLAAIAVGAALFGLAHAGGGYAYMLLAAIAGVGYGFAYRRGGMLAAVVAHAVFNMIHFGFFTYPMLAG